MSVSHGEVGDVDDGGRVLLEEAHGDELVRLQLRGVATTNEEAPPASPRISAAEASATMREPAAHARCLGRWRRRRRGEEAGGSRGGRGGGHLIVLVRAGRERGEHSRDLAGCGVMGFTMSVNLPAVLVEKHIQHVGGRRCDEFG